MPLVWRLSAKRSSGPYLPMHHAYSDPWEEQFDEDAETVTYVDRRGRGAQVWPDLSRAIYALAGGEVDGRYPADRYPYLLTLDASETWDSPGEWVVVRPGFLSRAWVASSKLVLRDIRKAMLGRAAPGERVDAWEVEEYATSRPSRVHAIVGRHSRLWTPRWVETLPPPR